MDTCAYNDTKYVRLFIPTNERPPELDYPFFYLSQCGYIEVITERSRIGEYDNVEAVLAATPRDYSAYIKSKLDFKCKQRNRKP